MNALYALFAAIVLYLVVYVGIRQVELDYYFGVVIPYAAIAVFLLGFIYRILKWAENTDSFRTPSSAQTVPSNDPKLGLTQRAAVASRRRRRRPYRSSRRRARARPAR